MDTVNNFTTTATTTTNDNFTSNDNLTFSSENIFFDCHFETDAVFWQLGCLLATYFILHLQTEITQSYWTTIKKFKIFYQTQCKCFYIKKVSPSPPEYKEVFEKELPSYTQAVTKEHPLPSYFVAVGNTRKC